MKYDFTSIIDRQGKDALAVDGVGENPGFAPDKPKEGFDVIPMWVADMNFATVPTVPEEVIKRFKLLQQFNNYVTTATLKIFFISSSQYHHIVKECTISCIHKRKTNNNSGVNNYR